MNNGHRHNQLLRPCTPGLGGNILLPLLLIAVAGFLAYSNSFSVPFVLDDGDSIVDNPVIKNLQSFLSGAGYAYNPRRFVGYLTFALNYHFGGLNVLGYHLVNLCIHIANGFLVYALATLAVKAASLVNGERETVNGKTASADHHSPLTDYLPLFAALLFVVHPVQTQAVTYIVQRLASLATLFYLGAVVCYAKGRDQGSGTSNQKKHLPIPGPWSPVPWYLLAIISGLLALKTKEIAVTLPLAIILYEFVFHGASKRKVTGALLLAVTGLVAAGVFVLKTSPDFYLLSESFRASSSLSRSDYLITQFAVIATYLRLLVLPINQNLDYDYPVYHSLFQTKPMLGLLLHLVLIGVAIYAWKKAGEGRRAKGERNSNAVYSPFTIHHSLLPAHYSLIAFGIFWFYLTLIVESSFIPIQDVIVEHRLYLPSMGFSLAVAAGGAMLLRKVGERRSMIIAAIIILVLAGATWKRNHVWRSPESLWQDTAAKSPDKPRVLMALGNLQLDRGDQETAIALYSRAIQRDPTYFPAHLNMGIVMQQRGMTDSAIQHLQRARDLAPDRAPIYYHLGMAYYDKGMVNNSIPFFSRAVDLAPENSRYRATLTKVVQAADSQSP
jgi:tetratricopeptide (TPR) repeat protein